MWNLQIQLKDSFIEDKPTNEWTRLLLPIFRFYMYFTYSSHALHFYLQPSPSLPLSLNNEKNLKINCFQLQNSKLYYHHHHHYYYYVQPFSETRVFMGFSFSPMLSGERSSGEMHDGLSGLLGLSLKWVGL